MLNEVDLVDVILLYVIFSFNLLNLYPFFSMLLVVLPYEVLPKRPAITQTAGRRIFGQRGTS